MAAISVGNGIWLLGHSKIESIIRYLGIEVEDALEMAERTGVGVAGTEAARWGRLPGTRI